MIKNGKNDTTRHIILIAALTLIVFLLQTLGIAFKLGFFSVAIVGVPILIGAVTVGPLAGAWLGFVFGLAVLLSGDAALFYEWSPVATVVLILLKGCLAGFLSGMFYKLTNEKLGIWAFIIAACIFTIVNAEVFVAFVLTVFSEQASRYFAEAGAGELNFISVHSYFGGMNIPFELIINIGIGGLFYGLIQNIHQKIDEKDKNYSTIVKTLSNEFCNIYLASIKDGSIQIIKQDILILNDNTKSEGIASVKYAEAWEYYISNFVHKDDADEFREVCDLTNILNTFRKTKSFLHTYRSIYGGVVNYYQITFTKMDNSIIIAFRDVNSVVEHDEKQRVLLENALKQTELANQAKTNFLLSFSKDIKIPMNEIREYTDLMDKHQDNPEKRNEYINEIKKSTDTLNSIINNVEEMARIEKGSVPMHEVVWNAETFNDSLYSVFKDMMRTKDIEFTRKITVYNKYVYCDPTILREMFVNILSNAYKYTNPGGKVTMHLNEIYSDMPGYAMYQTTITDTGVGMSEEFLSHIYEDYYREFDSTEKNIEGSGLGMSITKKLVDIMNGTITVESVKGQGTTVTVTLPHRVASEEDINSLNKDK